MIYIHLVLTLRYLLYVGSNDSVLTSFYQGVEEMRVTEDKLWELCQNFKDGQLINLVLAHNIVANIKREDFQAAR